MTTMTKTEAEEFVRTWVRRLALSLAIVFVLGLVFID
jgi:hypothetical protein